MKPSQTIRFGMATIALVLLSAACVHPSDSDSSGSGSSASETSSSPQTESTTGLESPVPSTNEPSLSLAPAPTGRTGDSGANDQCIQVSWLGNNIPQGDIVTITSVAVKRPFTFDSAVTAQCGGAPSCLNYQFSTANDSDQFCNVGLGYKYGSINLDGPEPPKKGSLELIGRISCRSSVSSAACQRDAVAMQRPGIGTVTFDVYVIDNTPPPSSPSASTTVSPPEISSSSPPASSSSSPVATGSP